MCCDGGYGSTFSALQRAENSSMHRLNVALTRRAETFSALQRAENSSIRWLDFGRDALHILSVLFSEPKIPQFVPVPIDELTEQRLSVLFSEPKIPQSRRVRRCAALHRSAFSALQRAENSSMLISSSSTQAACRSFSALQRAENSSIHCSGAPTRCSRRLSVLFSEPKIPQSKPYLRRCAGCSLSVLFSEPKIPQFRSRRTPPKSTSASFSALQRAENSSIKEDAVL